MELVLMGLGAYLLGAVPFGVLAARAKGVDLSQVGSGNVGATNVARALGKPTGIAVFVLDVMKGAVPPFVGQQVLKPLPGFGVAEQCLMLGLLAVLGHTCSVFLKFKGGKGVATGLGAVLGTSPIAAAAGFGGFLVLFALTRIVSLSSLVGCVLILVAAVWLRLPVAHLVVYSLLVTYVFWRHRENIKRLLRGEEPKFKSGGVK
jgi:acyl phosphate:glycerol-3-phosphate acyltransferase